MITIVIIIVWGYTVSTKEKVLETALELFSRRGFSAVSVRDIAAAVGVRESAMYRHFESKQAVFDALVHNYCVKGSAFMGSIHALPSTDAAYKLKTATMYKQLNDADFLRIGGSVFTDFLMQPDILKFWRMISIERMNDKKLAQMWKTHLFDEPIEFQTGLFNMLIQIGAIKPNDPQMLALEFFTPLLLLYMQTLPFEADSPEFAYFMDYANRHMLHFRQIYGVDT